MLRYEVSINFDDFGIRKASLVYYIFCVSTAKKEEISHQKWWIQLVSYSTWFLVVTALQY